MYHTLVILVQPFVLPLIQNFKIDPESYKGSCQTPQSFFEAQENTTITTTTIFGSRHLDNYNIEENQDWNRCINENSLTLGRCVYKCENNQQCEDDCLAGFKTRHLNCPCEVFFLSLYADLKSN